MGVLILDFFFLSFRSKTLILCQLRTGTTKRHLYGSQILILTGFDHKDVPISLELPE